MSSVDSSDARDGDLADIGIDSHNRVAGGGQHGGDTTAPTPDLEHALRRRVEVSEQKLRCVHRLQIFVRQSHGTSMIRVTLSVVH